jgi:hypothetical protein
MRPCPSSQLRTVFSETSHPVAMRHHATLLCVTSPYECHNLGPQLELTLIEIEIANKIRAQDGLRLMPVVDLR